MAAERAVGKCAENHLGSYGYPTRPEEPYAFCAQCGFPMVWAGQECASPLPEDTAELISARFCRQCGHGYFDDTPPSEAVEAGAAV